MVFTHLLIGFHKANERVKRASKLAWCETSEQGCENAIRQHFP